MEVSKKNILLAGRPRVGKSTLILKVVETLKKEGCLPGGFYTIEVREGGSRIGFDINTLDGKTGVLARVGLKSSYRLGKYGIDMEQFEEIALAALEDAIEKREIIIIDEIGYMELKSRRFRELVLMALDSQKPVLATVMKNRFDFSDSIKARDDTEVIRVRVDNRDILVDKVTGTLKKLKSW
jgi:nucleoside-triphosphatase